MRLLWGASAQPGSLFPAVPLVLELLRRGHQVTALSDPDAESTFRALGCMFLPERRAQMVPPPARPLTRESKARWWRDYALAVFADTEDALRDGSYDLVLADPLEPGLDFAAESLGVPYCSYVHWGLDECGPDVPFSHHLWDGETPVDRAFAAWWNELRDQAGLPPESRPVGEHRWYRTSPTLTLLLGLPELVHPRGALPPGVLRVGPTVWDPPATRPLPAWVATLGTERPAVLASVSTVARGATAAGFALTLLPPERDRDRIHAALEQLQHEPRFAEAARQLAVRATDYDAPAMAADLVESVGAGLVGR
jgi:hypothetical protein